MLISGISKLVDEDTVEITRASRNYAKSTSILTSIRNKARKRENIFVRKMFVRPRTLFQCSYEESINSEVSAFRKRLRNNNFFVAKESGDQYTLAIPYIIEDYNIEI
ncbi:hypothetical protein V1477_010525 [Vespula maculifrons]|uniref:Uncharacterized protein n=1 Tax=Vespula maculifrons TaxID=7453 RepID=A0ABD2C269_VESMC